MEATNRAVAYYPIEALREGTQGRVWVKFFVSEAGDVESVEFVSGDKIFERAALDAAKKWKFKPFITDGKPVKVVTTIPFDFAFGEKVEAIKRVAAYYPIEAQREGTQGRVWVKFFVSEAGDVDSVEFVNGDRIFERAALDTAKKWKFKPLIRDGKPVKVVTTIPFDFAFGEKVTDTSPPTNAAADNRESTKPVRVSQAISQGLLIHKVEPVYPESARQGHIQGTVVLEALIGKNGWVIQLTPVSGPKELVPAAMGAVQQWRYKPYLRDGQPVEARTQITVKFQLRY